MALRVRDQDRTRRHLVPMPIASDRPIPRVVHQIWVGEDPPDWVWHSWENWTRDLPEGWTLRLWGNDDVAGHPVLARTVDAARGLGIAWRGVSNILRVQIVALFGGIYTDVDCLLLDPAALDALAGDRASWIACADKSREQAQMENSAFGFRPGHAFLHDVADEAERNLRRGLTGDWYLGGSRSFRMVWDRQQWDYARLSARNRVEVRWDYTTSRAPDLRHALRSTASVDRAAMMERYGPFPIAHVWKPRVV
jgi:mannosyltransferase OCH1-like enzyme